MNDELITTVTGNLFAAMGSKNAEELEVKSTLLSLIQRDFEAQKIGKKKAARLLDLNKKTAARLVRGQIRAFSTYELMEFVRRLGYNVEIVVEPRNARKKPLRIDLAKAAEYSIKCERMSSRHAH